VTEVICGATSELEGTPSSFGESGASCGQLRGSKQHKMHNIAAGRSQSIFNTPAPIINLCEIIHHAIF
jgi:hypothetical protein